MKKLEHVKIIYVSSKKKKNKKICMNNNNIKEIT